MSREDKITRQQVDVWAQELWSTSFLSSVVNTSESGITGTIGRYGTFNAINLEIQKKEESAANASFDAAYRGAKGSTFYLGFKNGEPVALVVTEVSNAANVRQGLTGAKGVTTVVLSALVSDTDLARLRGQLTSQPIDAVRILLSGDLQIDKSVDGGDGRKMMEKFACFYQALDKRGTDLSLAAKAIESLDETVGRGESKDYAPTASGKYSFKKGGAKPGDYIDLDPSGSFFVRQNGQSFGGTYTVRGDVLTMLLPNGQADRGRFSGNTIIDSDGWTWEKPADLPRTQAPALTVDTIIQMVGVKIPDDVIISSIEKSGTKFSLTPEELIKLKGAGVSDAVLRAMSKLP